MKTWQGVTLIGYAQPGEDNQRLKKRPIDQGGVREGFGR